MFTEIRDLVDAADRDITRLDRAITNPPGEEIPEIIVKRIVDAQRAALDFLASRVTERFGRTEGHTYYPLSPTAAEFNDSIDRRMPGVRSARPDIAAVIERHQPFQPDGDWLTALSSLANENKHEGFTQQERISVKRVFLRNAAGTLAFNPEKPLGQELATAIEGLMTREGGAAIRSELEVEDVRLKELGASAPSVLRAIQVSLVEAIDEIIRVVGRS